MLDANKKEQNGQDIDNVSDAEEHVRKIMDPSEADPIIDQAQDIDIFANHSEATTAPEILEAKIPVEPSIELTKTHEFSEETLSDDEKDADTDKVVDEIIAKEGDDLLEAEDKELAKAFNDKKPSLKDKLRNFFVAWWVNKKARYITIGSLAGLLIVATVVPVSRYFMFNALGVRASASMTIFDDSTGQPLKKVTVTLSGQTGKTDSDGKVNLKGLKLGTKELVIEKRAFAVEKRKITVGWGSNPLGDYKLLPIGSQYTFLVTDFLSGKVIHKAEASSGDANAISDEEGKIILTVEASDNTELKVVIKSEGYRSEEIIIPTSTKEEKVIKLVSARKEIFVSKRSGKYDLYSVDIDGKNEKIVLAGTGSERDDLALVPDPINEAAAYVSTRENKRNKDGYLLSTLTLIDLQDNSSEDIVTSELVQVVGWSGDRLVFVQVTAGSSAANPKRQRLMSHNSKTGQNQELAASNYFNDVMMIGGRIYYATSDTYQNGASGFYGISSDGSNKQTILNKETWNLFRTSYDHLILSAQDGWYDYKIGDKQVTKLGGQPANPVSRIYVDSPDNKHSLWIDVRDGKRVLISYDIKTGEDKILQTKAGITNPVRWLDNRSLIFRMITNQETSDYALNIDGGNPVKIVDVTNVVGLGRWYYY
ncbi:carboxypeptidase regulatory-like domain-containing protein [Candidatus Saccharibacteria bacterium]|nr:carboxypeptidase regulatory-like domain-containing protein [Candidatus Saccharibacteria bacterium]MBI3337720.1 carboxypeptidase regulatory-like domain-containing protein [Candidatus Saccharibacteria bacterium]